MLDLVWLAIAFPLAGALINGLFGRLIRNKLISGVIGCTALGLSFAVALVTYFSYNAANGVTKEPLFHEVSLWPWIHVGNLQIDALLLIDPLSIVMMLFVTGVSFLIHIYSTSYMAHDDGYPRFFTYLNLFVAMMLRALWRKETPRVLESMGVEYVVLPEGLDPGGPGIALPLR